MYNNKITILLIAYIYPPFGGMTPQRLGILTKHLVDEGIVEKIDVITINPELPNVKYWIDKSAERYVSEKINFYYTKPGLSWWLFEKIYSMITITKNVFGLNENKNQPKEQHTKIYTSVIVKLEYIYNKIIKPLLFPDSRIEWFPSAFYRAQKLMKANKYDLIWSFGFPFTSHIIAWSLCRTSKIPWIAEYGDPWSFNPDVEDLPVWRRKLDYKFEGLMLNQVSRIVVCTEATKEGYIKFFPKIKPNIIKVVEHGYDAEKYQNNDSIDNQKFRIVYTGIFYENFRNPTLLFETISLLPEDEIEVIIAGDINYKYVTLVNTLGISNKVSFLGKLSHKEVIELQKGATLLLTFGWLGGYQIPGKLYEYFGSRRPILNISSGGVDASADLIETHNRGISVNYSKHVLYETLIEYLNLWKKGLFDSQFNLNCIDSMKWEVSAKKMADIIKV